MEFDLVSMDISTIKDFDFGYAKGKLSILDDIIKELENLE